MTTTQTRRPSGAQLALLLGLVRAGGTYSRFAGAGRPASIQTVDRCKAEGWIEPAPERDGAGRYTITDAGRLAAAAADAVGYKAAVLAYDEKRRAAAREALRRMAPAMQAAVDELPGLAAGLAAEVEGDDDDGCEGHESPASRVVIDEGLPELMSVTEVAALHGLHRSAVKKMISVGRLPARQAGSTWVIRRAVAEGITIDGDVLEDEAAEDCDAPPGEGLADRAEAVLRARGVTEPAAVAQVRASAMEVAAAAEAEGSRGSDTPPGQ